jgi:tetratricopeptide (TPR) repeat protein
MVRFPLDRIPQWILGASAAVTLAVLSAVPVRGATRAEGWVEARTPHLAVYTDAGPERAAELAVRLERFRAAFARLAPDLELRSPAPTRVLAFADYEPWKTVPDGGGARVLGQFLAGPDGNFITLAADPEQGDALGVIQHEYVHHLIRHNFPRVPLWFNEGLAEYYRTFEVKDGEAILGRPPEDRLRWLDRNARLEVSEVLTVSGDSPRHGAETAGRFYAVSWALVHYLLSGDGARLDATADWLTRVAVGDEPLGAFEEAFGVRVVTLERELAEYVHRGEYPAAAFPVEGLADDVEVWTVDPAEVHAVLGDLLERMGRPGAAREQYHEALERAPGLPEALSGLAALEDRVGSSGEARVLHRSAVAGNPRSALVWLRYGRHLLRRTEEAETGEMADRFAEEARVALARAVERDPDFAEARALLGQTYLFGDADPRDGVPHLEAALERMPSRMDLVFHLIQLYIKAEDFPSARARIEHLRRWGETEMAERAQEALERGALVQAANRALEEGDVDKGLRLFDEAVSLTSDPDMREQMEEQLVELQRRARRR